MTSAAPPPRRWGGRAWLLLALTLAAAALTARLGLWQLDRAAQKTALQQATQARQTEPPLPQAQLAVTAAQAQAQHHRRATLQGRWLERATVYLENRQMQGRPGFYVVTPLQLADGSAVLVQRGWLPRDAADRTRVQAPPVLPDEVTVTGRIAPPPSRLYEFDGAASGPIRQNLDIPAFAAESGLALRPLSLVQTEPEASASVPAAASDTLQRDWPEPAAGVHKHHGYAFQWFALSALILGLYVWFQLLAPRRRRPAAV